MAKAESKVHERGRGKRRRGPSIDEIEKARHAAWHRCIYGDAPPKAARKRDPGGVKLALKMLDRMRMSG